MATLKFGECQRCGAVKMTVDMFPNEFICFECAEEPYQVLAAYKSREIVMRYGSGKTGAIMPMINEMEAG